MGARRAAPTRERAGVRHGFGCREPAGERPGAGAEFYLGRRHDRLQSWHQLGSDRGRTAGCSRPVDDFRYDGQFRRRRHRGPIAPDSWTFTANSQSYAIIGADVNFSLAGTTGGVINNANSGQTISISNNIGESAAGVQLQQLGSSTLILSGINSYTGSTVVSGGTLLVTGSIASSGGVFVDTGATLGGTARFRDASKAAIAL